MAGSGHSKIREARASDALVIAAIGIDAWRARYADFLPAELLAGLSPAKRSETIAKTIAEGNATIVVLELHGTVIGFCIFGADDEDNSRGQIHAIYLTPSQWHRGFGTLLMNRALAILYEKNYKAVAVWSFIRNHSSNRFYERIGFVRTGRTKAFIGKNNELAAEFLLEMKHCPMACSSLFGFSTPETAT